MQTKHYGQAAFTIGLIGFVLCACMPVRPATSALATVAAPTPSALTPAVVNRTAITASGVLTATVAQTASQTVKLNQGTAAPVIEWSAVVNPTADQLTLVNKAGKKVDVFTAGGALGEIGNVTWSPDQHYLLFILNNWRHDPATGVLTPTNRPLQLWRVILEDHKIGEPQIVFTSPTPPDTTGGINPEQIVFGQWSPNQRYFTFWQGILSASILADGLPLWLLDAEIGQAKIASVNADGTPSAALVNSRYQSWAPDSSALAMTVGGYRSAQVHKWLALYDIAFRQAKVVISDTEQIPGIVAWSPRADWLAYAAVPADQTSDQWADLMTFANPAIAGRRIYLLNPTTGEHRRLNQVDAFQDAPTWSSDGKLLYYVERDGDTLQLLAADPATGQAKSIESAERPAAPAVGYYGQGQWDDLLAYRPDASHTELPRLTETYINPAHGFSLRYPAGWVVTNGAAGAPEPGIGTLQPSVATPNDLGPFSGKAIITLAVSKTVTTDLDTLVPQLLSVPGPGQYLEPGHPARAYQQTKRMLATHPALRLKTVDDFGVVNHLVVVASDAGVLMLRSQGDGRLFDAIVETLQLR